MNDIGQRTNLTTAGTAFGVAPVYAWSYNHRGELVQANDSSTVNHNRAYQFDDIGNRQKSSETLLAGLPATANYQSNALNQYTSVPGTPASVTPSYDDDGNATAYPLPEDQSANSTLVWDGENRLIRVIRPNNGGIIEYRYDYLSRRLTKTASAQFITYLYDGWNCLAEHQENVLQHTYTWGKDLSGSMQGAGGVGGLLSQRDEFAAGAPVYYPTYDGNGNISEYLEKISDNPDTESVDEEETKVVAHFEYDAFGNITESSGTIENFDIRFSTKKRDAETGLYYYGYRYYDPGTGRWPSRDPLGENHSTGEFNEYAFVRNAASYFADLLGLTIIGGDISGKTGNCFGGALTNDGAIDLSPTHKIKRGQSLKKAIESQFGYKCREVKSVKACKCKCSQEKVLITLYKRERKNKKRNPWTDPKFEWNFDKNGVARSDLHAVRDDTGCENDYKQIPRRQRGIPGQGGFNRNINWKLFKGNPLLCCCRERK